MSTTIFGRSIIECQSSLLIVRHERWCRCSQTVNDRFERNEKNDELSIMKLKSSLVRHQSALVSSDGRTSCRRRRRWRHRCRTQPTATLLRRRQASQCSADEFILEQLRNETNENLESTFDRTANNKILPTTIVTRNNVNYRHEPVVNDMSQFERISTSICPSQTLKTNRSFRANHTTNPNKNKQISKQILHAIMNSMNHNQESVVLLAPYDMDEYFDNRPLSNPNEPIVHTGESIY
jgi:hypothetical protein